MSTIEKPRFGYGLYIPNPTFSVLGTATGRAGGWSFGSGLAYESIYSGLPQIGHQRAQRIVYAGTDTAYREVISYPTKPYALCANKSFMPYFVFTAKISGTSYPSNWAYIEVFIHSYDINDNPVGSATHCASLKTNYDSWTTFSVNEIAYTPPSGTHHLRLRLVFVRGASGSDIIFDVAFIGICTNLFQVANGFTHPGSDSVPVGARASRKDPWGRVRHIDGDKYAIGHELRIGFDHISASDNSTLMSMYQANFGRDWDGPTANPGGGQWPILIMPGNPASIGAGYFDCTDQKYPMTVQKILASEWYSGTMSFEELI